MPCSFCTPQDCTSSKVTEIEEHLSSGSPLPDHVVDGPLPSGACPNPMCGPSAEVYGEWRREEREEEVQQSLHMLHHWTYPLATPLTHSPDLEIGAISPIISLYVCIHVIHAPCINRFKRAASFIHGDLVRSP